MIPVIEDYLFELVQSKLTELRDDPEQIQKILGISQRRMLNLQEYISRTPVKVIMGYPRTPAELPCISIMLSGETETQEGLGDLDFGESHTESTTELAVVVDTLGGKVDLPYIQLSRKPMEDITSIYSQALGTTLDPIQDYYIADSEASIVAFPNGMVEHDDILEITYTHGTLESIGTRVLYEADYRLEVWTTNGDLTVELYHLVKWALLVGRDFLGYDKYIYRQKLGGSDFEPATGYFPEFVYRRSVTYWCQFSAFVPDEDIGYIEEAYSNLVPIDSNFSLGGEDSGN